MKFYEKISKSGVFCDKRFEHGLLVTLVQLSNTSFSVVEALKTDGEFSTDVNFFHSVLDVNVAIYDDGIVRCIASVENKFGNLVEVGRLLVDEQSFFGTVKHFTSRKQVVL